MNDQLNANDLLLSQVAGDLALDGLDAASEALLRSELEIAYGESWWDGHDTYVYDVDISLTAPDDVEAQLDLAWQALARALGARLSLFVDDGGEWRCATLKSTRVSFSRVEVEPTRRARRRTARDRTVAGASGP